MSTRFFRLFLLGLTTCHAYCAPPPPLPQPDGSLLIPPPGRRQTKKATSIDVYRFDNNFVAKPKRLKNIKKFEAEFAKVYPESKCRISGTQYAFLRNCHDFVWGMYMSSSDVAHSTYPQAWWMNDPSANWIDGSFTPHATAMRLFWTSSGYVASGAPADAAWEFFFQHSVLDLLPQTYQDGEGRPIYLPVLLTDEYADQGKQFIHSALMANARRDPPYSYVAGTVTYSSGSGAAEACYCYYISKWAECGVYRHRIGTPFCPPEYLKNIANQVHPLDLFVPGWQGPYTAWTPSPWGLPPYVEFDFGP